MFLRDLQEAWEEKGKAVIEAAMATKPLRCYRSRSRIRLRSMN
jgi:hypothetical protein